MTVRALLLTGHGPPERTLEVRELPDPPVGDREVRVRVRAAGVNFADVSMRVGIYPDIPKLPAVIGYEVAGEVESVGASVDGLEVGQRVCAALPRLGGFAELVSADAANVFEIPDTLTFAQAAAIPLSYCTAYVAVNVLAYVHTGETVLVHSAAGGVGISALQLLRERGAVVIGTASASKHDAARAHGATHMIDYRTQDVRTEVLRITGARGVDVVLDSLGRTRESYALLRPGGRLVAYGFTGAVAGQRNRVGAALRGLPRYLAMPRFSPMKLGLDNKAVSGMTLQRWWAKRPVAEQMEPLLALAREGKIEPVVAKTFPLDEAAQAHRFLEERRNIGKVVLEP